MNFLFFSKLLPLFLYPLGLSCLLLLFSLYLCWRRSQRSFVPVLLALVLLVTAGNARVSNQLVKSLEWQHLPASELPSADAIVVLGGATRNISSPRTFPDLSDRGDRLLQAAQLYQAGKAPLIILSGGRIQWYGGGESEAKDMATILELVGIPKDAIILEPNSLNTYQNAVNTKVILEQKKIDNVLLVTSAFHMPRSISIFEKQGISVIPAPTDFLISEQELQAPDISAEAKILSYIPNVSSLDRTTIALKEYIGTFIYRLKGWI